MVLTFYRVQRKGDKEILEPYQATADRVQVQTDRGPSEVQDAVAKIFLPANSKVKGDDRVLFNGQAKSFLVFYRVKHLDGTPSHIEVTI